MMVRGKIKKGSYYDSITLMRVGKAVAALEGVTDAAVVMGTQTNKGILGASGLYLSDFDATGDTDLLIAIKSETEAAVEKAMAEVENELKEAMKKKSGGSGAARPSSLEGAVEVLPGANMAIISVAGRYAGDVAMEALERGLHVMLFSDNVPLETEIALKKYGRDHGLLVMGPDCGTAIVNGAPLAFANIVPRGSIGVVAAAGTGLQEVTCLIANEGGGISQALGTGGRDVKKDVGGIMFIEGLKALAADEKTKAILLISKPPHPEVLKKIEEVIRGVKKPVVSMFLGDESAIGPRTLEEAALTVLALSKGESAEEAMRLVESRDMEMQKTAKKLAERLAGRKFIRGLFSGGTFCAEAQVIFRKLGLKGVFSNAPTAGAAKLKDSLKSEQHSIVDYGEDEFTVGRPHPMIDFSLRNKRIQAEASDSKTAIILLDVVLGFGAHMDPASELTPVVREAARNVAVVCSVTATEADPQHRRQVIEALEEAGAIVLPSNAAACHMAGFIVSNL
ncbi:MAG: acyl-CoA synthetase FdrA [Verrucomicrobia bacterium]|nr:acyl-CoA synthetase FdrA [Verrucomicrobiota bacterium]MBU1909780.1 acyl-CoA synthetase FdrA [Verrucomicrobiota bacterium]